MRIQPGSWQYNVVTALLAIVPIVLVGVLGWFIGNLIN